MNPRARDALEQLYVETGEVAPLRWMLISNDYNEASLLAEYHAKRGG